MAVNSIKGAYIPTRDVGGLHALARSGNTRAAGVVHALDRGAIPAGSEVGSTYDVVDLASNALIDPASELYIPNLGAGVTLNFGDLTYPSGLLAGQGAAAAATVRVTSGKTNADIGKMLWELLGYPDDPKKAIRLRFTIAGATTSNAGVIGVNISGASA